MVKRVVTYTCHTCSTPFSALSSRAARYCSPACRQKAHRERVKTTTLDQSTSYDQLSQAYRAALVKIEVMNRHLSELAKEQEQSLARIRYLEDLINRMSVDRKAQPMIAIQIPTKLENPSNVQVNASS